MRFPVQRAGLVVAIAALVLLGVYQAWLHIENSARSGGPGTAQLVPASGAASRTAPGSPASPASELTPSRSGRGRTSTETAELPAVGVAGIAALPTAHVHPGYDSPEDAVDGFYQALLGGTPTQACTYVTTPCPSFGSGPITGTVSILDAVSDHGQALVQVTGTICRSTSCRLLTDLVVMPTGPASFGTSWASLTSRDYGWAGSPLPCVQDPATGQWHVKLS
jgi:hypothetical protein